MEVKRMPDGAGKKPIENRSGKWMPVQKVNSPFFSIGTLSDREAGKSPYSGGHSVGFQIKETGQDSKKPAQEGYHDSILETARMMGRLTPEQQADPKIMELAKNLLEKMNLILEAKQARSP